MDGLDGEYDRVFVTVSNEYIHNNIYIYIYFYNYYNNQYIHYYT
jgi:hypothetical protein